MYVLSFAVTKGKKAVIGSYDEYDTYKDEIQEAVGGRVRLMTNGNVLPQTLTALEPPDGYRRDGQ